jgi:hypothetical protein
MILHRSPPTAASQKRRLDCLSSRLLGRAAARSGFCREHRTGTGVGIQAIHGDDLLPVAHLDGESLAPLETTRYGLANGASRGFCRPPTRT